MSYDINTRLQALAESEVICAHLKPVFRLLVNIKTTANLDRPAVAESDFPVVHVRILLDDQLDVEELQAVRDGSEFCHGFVLLELIVELRD